MGVFAHHAQPHLVRVAVQEIEKRISSQATAPSSGNSGAKIVNAALCIMRPGKEPASLMIPRSHTCRDPRGARPALAAPSLGGGSPVQGPRARVEEAEGQHRPRQASDHRGTGELRGGRARGCGARLASFPAGTRVEGPGRSGGGSQKILWKAWLDSSRRVPAAWFFRIQGRAAPACGPSPGWSLFPAICSHG